MRLRFRLRTLLTVISVLCLFFAPIGWWRHRVGSQLRALDSLQTRGARIFYDYQVKMIAGRHACDNHAESPSGLFVRCDGVRGACDVAGVWCPRYRNADGTVAHEFADNDMQVIAPLKDIKFLLIDSRNLSDDGTSVLDGLRTLEDIGLNSPKITDLTAERLARHNSLTAISLDGTSVTDQGVVALGGLHELMVLNLSYTRITGASLTHIGRLRGLIELHLRGTAIGSGQLNALKGLQMLETLDVRDTGVSDAEIAELEADLPKVTIYR